MRLLLQGGSIYAPSVPRAEAMLVVDREIAWIGPDAGAAVHRDTTDSVVHLSGALVAPAFVDAHAHHTATGLRMLRLDLAGVPSRNALLAAVSGEARRLRGRTIVGFGWDETQWADSTLPTRQELDRASWGSAAYLVRVDGLSSLVSSALIAEIPPLRGSSGFRDSGWMTGPAHSLAYQQVTAGLPRGLRDAAQRAAREHAAAAGVAAVHEATVPGDDGGRDLAALTALAQTTLGPDLVTYRPTPDGPPPHDPSPDGPPADGLPVDGLPATAPPADTFGASVTAAGVDVVVDGSIGSGTALLRDGYASEPEPAPVVADVDAVAERVVACTQAGVQARVHATGDAAIDVVVAALRRAVESCGAGLVRSARHRVEHLSMATPEQLATLAEAGVVASVQPACEALWGAPGGAYEQQLGEERASALHDVAAMARVGMGLAFGSSSPTTPIAPWEWVRAAMSHHRSTARISGRAAFAAATRGGWRAAGRDDAGVLEPGAQATFAVWATEKLAVQAPDTRVANWSTDPRSGTPGLPRLEPGSPAPACLATVNRGLPIHVADDARVGHLTGRP